LRVPFFYSHFPSSFFTLARFYRIAVFVITSIAWVNRMEFEFSILDILKHRDVLFAYVGDASDTSQSPPESVTTQHKCASSSSFVGEHPSQQLPIDFEHMVITPSPSSPPESRKLSRKKKDRLKYRAKESVKEARRLKRMGDSQRRLKERFHATKVTVLASPSVMKLPRSQFGFTGSLAHDHRAAAERLKTDARHFDRVMQSLRPIAFDASLRAPTEFRDSHGILFGLRAFRDQRMTPNFMMRLMCQIDALVSAVGLRLPREPHARGNFAQMLLGYTHGMGNARNHPYHTLWHTNNEAAINAFIVSAEMQHVIRMVEDLVKCHFPGIASLYARNNEFWRRKTDGKIKMEFGLFFNLAINVDMGMRVRSVPHRDMMNLAFGICIIIAFGFFNDGILAWLVNLEARIVIQIPPLVPYCCLSSLITHFNVDRHEFWSGRNRLDLVTTENWEVPTSSNTTPLSAIGSGRGSLVFYNQGSTFHWMLTGHQYMTDAIDAFGSWEKLAASVMAQANQAFGK